MNSKIKEIADKALEGKGLEKEETAILFEIPPFTEEAAYIQLAARKLNSKINNNTAEIHVHIGINLGPCANNCKWCSFAAVNKVFPHAYIMPIEEIVRRAKKAEEEGANAIYLVTTGSYRTKRLIENIKELRSHLKKETVLVANADDFSLEEAYAMKEAGLNGVYHAVRFRESIESLIPVEKRIATMQAAHRAGLTLGTCVEPVGVEHATQELVAMTIIAREVGAAFTGTMRRIPIPDTEIGQRGMMPEFRMAQINAVIRLATPEVITGVCWHEPSILGPLVGANLMWAETGSSPRDTNEDCEETRGYSVNEVRQMYWEAGWDVLEGPSIIWNPKATSQRALDENDPLYAPKVIEELYRKHKVHF